MFVTRGLLARRLVVATRSFNRSCRDFPCAISSSSSLRPKFLGLRSSQRISTPHQALSTKATLRNDDHCTYCWSCGAETHECELCCSKCTKIQAISSECDYFTLFQLPAEFHLDIETLERSYKRLQKQFHPDLYATKSPTERQLSAQVSAIINQGFQMLHSELSRGQYLLAKRYQVDVLHSGSSRQARHSNSNDDGGVQPDTELLMEIMELREELELCSSATQLQAFHTLVDANMKECRHALTQAFEHHQIPEATALIIRLQYLTKVQQEIQNKQEDMGL